VRGTPRSSAPKGHGATIWSYPYFTKARQDQEGERTQAFHDGDR
jgi:hypothetical protein